MQPMPASPAGQHRPRKAAVQVRARAKRAIAPAAGPSTKPSTKPIALALRGGGTQGAFAWGVLDRLVHAIRSDESMAALGASSRLNGDWRFLCQLRDRG